MAVKSSSPTPARASAEIIQADIEEAILSGQLTPGSRVNADELARTRGVSHIPVREALRALESDGWLTRKHNRGTYVRERDIPELADLFETRLVVEPQAARLAAQRRTVSQLNKLAEIVSRQETTSDDAALSSINCEFHVAIAECAHNRILLSIVADLNKRVRFYYLPAATGRHDNSVAEHRAIIAAITERDADRAAALITAHIFDTRTDAARVVDTPARSTDSA